MCRLKQLNSIFCFLIDWDVLCVRCVRSVRCSFRSVVVHAGVCSFRFDRVRFVASLCAVRCVSIDVGSELVVPIVAWLLVCLLLQREQFRCHGFFRCFQLVSYRTFIDQQRETIELTSSCDDSLCNSTITIKNNNNSQLSISSCHLIMN